MTQLVADRTPLEILAHVAERIEICDASGTVLGHFTPVNPERVQARYRNSAPRIDREELKRRKAQGRPGHTTRELFERLKSLTPDRKMQDYLQEKIDKLAE